MSKTPSLPALAAGFRSSNRLNENFTAIKTAFDNTLSRDGSTPNQMEAPLDMNSKRIINLPAAVDANDAVRKVDFDAYEDTAAAALAAALEAQADADAAAAATAADAATAETARDEAVDAQGEAADARDAAAISAGALVATLAPFALKNDITGANITGTVKSVRTLGFASAGVGPADYVRTSYGDIVSGGYSPLAYVRSADRLMPDGTTTDAVNGGYWLITGPQYYVTSFGAVGDGTTNDGPALQAAIDRAGVNNPVIFPKTDTNIWLTNQELFFYSGQRWEGVGGTNVLDDGTRIRLGAAASGVASGKDKLTDTKFGFSVSNILFDAQGYGDYGLSLYNCSYSHLHHIGGITTKANAATILCDANVIDKCYFNVINLPRLFASGTGGVCIRFTQGANRNQVFGGRLGGSYRGMEFLSLSADNAVFGTDFEENTDRHIYIDATGNKFVGCGMENAPIGYDITANGGDTAIIAPSFATSTTIQIQDASVSACHLATTREASVTVGRLRSGPWKMTSTYLTGSTHTAFDPSLFSSTAASDIRYWLNTNTSGLTRMVGYRANGTSQVGWVLNSTGEVTHGDLSQQAGIGSANYRTFGRRSGQPGSGTAEDGATFLANTPALGSAWGWSKVSSSYIPIVILPGATTVGDAAATLTPGTSNLTQYWNSPLTADRAVTLSTTGAWVGARFRIVRSAAATGAFNLNVGTGPLKALAVGTWCDVEYVGSAWVLTGYGTL